MSKENPYQDESWKEEAPLLSSLKSSKQEFDTPEGYFEELPGRIMERLSASDELDMEQEAPILARLKGEKGEQDVPEGFFESLPGKVMAIIQAEESSEGESWEAEAPILAAIPKNELPNQVPDGYFDQLPSKVMGRIHGEGQPKAPTARSRPWILWISVAASLLLLVTIGYVILSNPTVEEEEIFAQVEQLSEEEILHAIDLGEISNDEIVELMGDEALASLSFTQEIPEQDLEPYLKDLDLDDLDLSDLELDEALFEELLN